MCLGCVLGMISEEGVIKCILCFKEIYEKNNVCVLCGKDFILLEVVMECLVQSVDLFIGLRDYGYVFWFGNYWYKWGIY